jgi:hypothetical protein
VTIAEQKIDLGEFPAHLQLRGIAGPPKLSDWPSVYCGLLQKVSKTAAWKQYLASVG